MWSKAFACQPYFKLYSVKYLKILLEYIFKLQCNFLCWESLLYQIFGLLFDMNLYMHLRLSAWSTNRDCNRFQYVLNYLMCLILWYCPLSLLFYLTLLIIFFHLSFTLFYVTMYVNMLFHTLVHFFWEVCKEVLSCARGLLLSLHTQKRPVVHYFVE